MWPKNIKNLSIYKNKDGRSPNSLFCYEPKMMSKSINANSNKISTSTRCSDSCPSLENAKMMELYFQLMADFKMGTPISCSHLIATTALSHCQIWYLVRMNTEYSLAVDLLDLVSSDKLMHAWFLPSVLTVP